MNKNELQKKHDRLIKMFNVSKKVFLISGIGSAVSMAMLITSPFTIVSVGQSLGFLGVTSGVLFVSLMTSVDLNDKLENITKQLKSENKVEEKEEKAAEEEAIKTISEVKEETNQISNDYDNTNVVSMNNTRKRVLKPNNNQNN